MRDGFHINECNVAYALDGDDDEADDNREDGRSRLRAFFDEQLPGLRTRVGRHFSDLLAAVADDELEGSGEIDDQEATTSADLRLAIAAVFDEPQISRLAAGETS